MLFSPSWVPSLPHLDTGWTLCAYKRAQRRCTWPLFPIFGRSLTDFPCTPLRAAQNDSVYTLRIPVLFWPRSLRQPSIRSYPTKSGRLSKISKCHLLTANISHSHSLAIRCCPTLDLLPKPPAYINRDVVENLLDKIYSTYAVSNPTGGPDGNLHTFSLL